MDKCPSFIIIWILLLMIHKDFCKNKFFFFWNYYFGSIFTIYLWQSLSFCIYFPHILFLNILYPFRMTEIFLVFILFKDLHTIVQGRRPSSPGKWTVFKFSWHLFFRVNPSKKSSVRNNSSLSVQEVSMIAPVSHCNYSLSWDNAHWDVKIRSNPSSPLLCLKAMVFNQFLLLSNNLLLLRPHKNRILIDAKHMMRKIITITYEVWIGLLNT